MAKVSLRIDRSVPASLAEQIKGQITYAISNGILKLDDPLPSVRELAASLKVAPMTISHVYRDLAQEGLILTKSGVGTFVADITCLQDGGRFQPSQDNLYHIVDNCLRQATLVGHSVDQVEDMFLALAHEYRLANAVRHVLVVGNFTLATESYAHEIQDILRDLNVRAHVVLVDDLAADPDRVLADCKAANLVITVPTRLQEVRALLEPRHCHVAACAFRMNAETRRRLASILPTQRLGVVATYAEFLQTLAEEVTSYALFKSPLQYAHLGQARRIKQMLKEIDVLVYASGSEKVLEWLPETVEAFEFRHSPEAESVNRLRPLIAQAMPMPGTL